MAKVIEKQWYDIVSPKYFGKKVIGQTLTTDPNKIKGRVIETSLIELIGDAQKYYVKLFFKVDNVEGGKASTVFFGHDCTRDFTARIVQLRTDRIDTNDIVTFKDGKMRIKAIAITNRCVKRGLERDLRKSISDMVKADLEKMTVDDFLKGMVTGTIQKKIRTAMNKKYPIRQFEFRKSEVLA